MLGQGENDLSDLSYFCSDSGSSVSSLNSTTVGDSSSGCSGGGSGISGSGSGGTVVCGRISDLKPFWIVVAGLVGWHSGKGGRE